MRVSSVLIIAAVAVSATGASSAPTVFLSAKTGEAWWIAHTIVRPRHKSIDGIPLETLNSYRIERWPYLEKLCFIEAVDRQSYVGLDRSTQSEIEKTLAAHKGDPFRRSFGTPDGRRFVSQVAVQEECDSGKTGSIIITYDAATRAIADVVEWQGEPFRFLWPVEKPGVLANSSCFECGDWNVLYYDVGRQRFYWEAEGD